MPRYSLNLRPKYGRDEETGGERISRGIGTAIQQYMTREEAARQERNEVAARGGTPIESASPGVMDRVRGIGGALRRVLGRGGQPMPPGGVDNNYPIIDAGVRTTDREDVFRQGLQTGTDMARDGFGSSNVSPPLFGAPTPDIDAKGRVRGTNRFPTVAQPGGTPTMATPPSQPGRPALVENTPQPLGRTPFDEKPSFGRAIEPYIYEGQGGRKYQIDPMRQQRIAMQGREMERDADDRRTIAGEQRQQATRRAQQEEQIEAAVAAGMPRGEATARVRNNLMRYDEDFGQYRRPSTGMTQADRIEIEKLRQTNRTALDNARYQHAQALQSGNADAIRRAQLALSTAEFQYRMSEDRAKGFERTADDASRTVPSDPTGRMLATSTPEGTARVAAAESTAQANRDSAGRIRGEAAATATAAVRPDDTATRGPKKTVSARDAELKAQGKNADERRRILKSEGYNVR